MDVTNTPFDFRVRKSIGKDLYKDHIQLARGGGYDHPWKLTGGVELSAENGRRVTMSSDQNCVVLYSYNFPLEGHRKHQGLAVEFQSEPDGLHHEGFSDGILKKGDLYSQKTVYEFKVD
jgi:aldose 1-epimerase